MKGFVQKIFLGLASISLATSFCSSAYAQQDDWPTSNVRLYVPGSPGGPTDLIARTFAPYLENDIGKPVIVVNQGGAGGVVASTSVLEAEPNGGTLYITHALLHSAPAFGLTDITYKDFTPVGTITEADNVLVARADAPYDSLEELNAYAQENPEEIIIASFFGGLGQTMSDTVEAWSGNNMRSVDVGTDSDKLTSVLGKQTDLALLAKSTATQYVDAGKLKVLALLNDRPNPKRPEWPLASSGGLDLVLPLAYTVYLPGGADPALQGRLSNTVKGIVESPSFADDADRIDQVPAYRTPEEALDMLERESTFISAIIANKEKQ